jgi:hypothetical protein
MEKKGEKGRIERTGWSCHELDLNRSILDGHVLSRSPDGSSLVKVDGVEVLESCIEAKGKEGT